jgi:hypothetical protein
MLLVLVVLAFGGVTVLMLMAQRYSSLRTGRAENEAVASRPVSTRAQDPPAAFNTLGAADEIDVAEAQRAVDRFVDIRRAMKTALRGAAGQPQEAQRRLVEARRRALERSGLGAGEYEQVRVIYRQWRVAEPDLSTPFSRAFASRKEELRAADLGAYESLDP